MKRSGIDRHLILQPRDRRIIEALGALRFLDREQASTIAPFTSMSRAKMRLLRLVRAGYLDRKFVGTIAGGRKAIYFSPGSLKERRADRRLASISTERFVEHQLAVNSILLLMLEGAPARVELKRVKGPIGGDRGAIPDAYAAVDTPLGRLGMFFEVDLSTEPLATWRKKVRSYLSLSGAFASKEFQATKHRILVVAETEDRIKAIRSIVAESTDRVFWLASIKSIKSQGFWSPIWLRPNVDERRKLM